MGSRGGEVSLKTKTGISCWVLFLEVLKAGGNAFRCFKSVLGFLTVFLICVNE